MKDEKKTRLQLIQELNELRRKISKFNNQSCNSSPPLLYYRTPDMEKILNELKHSIFGKTRNRKNKTSNVPDSETAQKTPNYRTPPTADKQPFQKLDSNLKKKPPPDSKYSEKIRQKEIQYQDLFNSIQEPILAINPDLEILYCNEAFLKLLAQTSTAVINQNLLVVLPDFQETPFYPALLDTLSTRLTHEVQGWYHSRLFSAKIFPTNGGLLFVFEDLTQQNQFESELLKSEARFRLIMENIQDGILLFDNHVLTDVNERTVDIFGYSKREILSLWNQTSEPTQIFQPLQKFLQRPEKKEQEIWITRKDNSRRCLRIRKKTQHARPNKTRCYIILSDITQARHAEEALRNRDQILAAISEAALFLLHSSDYVKAIQKTVTILGKVTKVSRVFLFQPSNISIPNSSPFNFYWLAETDQPSRNLQEINDLHERYWKYWKKDLSAGKPVVSPLVPTDSNSLKINKIQTIAVIPIVIAKKLWGYLGFIDNANQRTWRPAEIEALKSAAGVIGSTLLRYHTEILQQIQKELGLKLGTTSQLPDAFRAVLTSVVQVDGIDCGAIFEVDPAAQTFTLLQEKNLPSDFLHQHAFFQATSPRLKETFSGNPLFLNEKQAASFPRILPKDRSFRAVLLIPIPSEDQVAAALYLASQTYGAIPEETTRILESLATQLGGIIRRIQMQTALIDNQKNLETLFNSIDDFLLIFNIKGQILHFNPAIQTRLGYSEDALLKMGVNQIFARTSATKLKKIFRKLEHQNAVLCQFPLVTREKTEIPAETKFSAGNWNGERIYFGVSRDISERKKVEQELENYRQHLEQLVEQRTAELQKLNAELKSFASTVSHDLKTPLRAISGFTQIIHENYADKLDANGLLYLQKISESSQKMTTLIEDLMTYSRLNQTEIRYCAVDLNQTVDEILKQLQSEIQHKQAQISVNSPLPTVYGNRIIIEQMLINLIQNGLKFVPPERSPKIIIRPENNTEYVRLWIEDNGIGIEEKYLNRIFNPFERLHPNKTFPGTGLGLAIVSKGIERLNGRFGVASIPGEGSKFWIELKKTSSLP